MAQHVHHRGEVQVLHSALASLREGQAQVLQDGKAGLYCPWAYRERGLARPPPALFRTLALPWKLNVSTYSPRRDSLCRTRNTPWASGPCRCTSWAACTLEMGPWNQG